MDKGDRSYSNDEIIVHWKPKLCIHATICFRELRSVFSPSKRPWVNMQGASSEEIIKIVEKCPTDALTWEYKDGVQEQIEVERPAEDYTEIKIMKDGPIVVTGDFIITDEKDRKYNKMKMTSFCRCGVSNNMPFCDGTHRKEGFEAG